MNSNASTGIESRPFVQTGSTKTPTFRSTTENRPGLPESMPLISASAALELGRRQFYQDIKTSLPLIAIDTLAVMLSVSVAMLVAQATGVEWPLSALSLGIVMSVLVVFFQYLNQLYPACGLSSSVEFGRCLRTCFAVAVVMGLGVLVLAFPSVVWLTYSTFVMCLSLSICLFRPLVRSQLANCSWWTQPIVILGDCLQARELNAKLEQSRSEGLRPMGMVVVGHQYWETGNEAVGVNIFVRKIEHLEHVLLGSKICRVAVAVSELGGAGYQRFRGIPHVMLPTGLSHHPVAVARLSDAGDGSELHFHSPLTHPASLLAKRCFDLLLVAVTLPFWGTMIAGIAIWMKLTDPGPIFYRQARVGRFNVPFDALKFRSMVVDADDCLEDYLESNPAAQAEWDSSHKLKQDPRITGVGNFLRKTSLDELPQLLNVLLGDMSLVGPRPIIDCDKYDREYIDDHPEVFDLYKLVRPGITGLWQISGRNHTTYKQRVYYDRLYLHNWTLATDLYILWRTVKTALFCEGAY